MTNNFPLEFPLKLRSFNKLDLSPPKENIAVRFEDSWNYETAPTRLEYDIIRYTPRGFWISYLTIHSDKKFILHPTPDIVIGVEKRFAYRDPKQALESYRMRKLRQIEHAKASIKKAEAMLAQLEGVDS